MIATKERGLPNLGALDGARRFDVQLVIRKNTGMWNLLPRFMRTQITPLGQEGLVLSEALDMMKGTSGFIIRWPGEEGEVVVVPSKLPKART